MPVLTKPCRKRERAAKLRERSKRRSKFHDDVIAASGGRCQNRGCISVLTHRTDLLHAHHIIKRSQGGTDDKENGIALCLLCHHYSHNGKYHHAGGWIKPNDFMVGVLTDLRERADWRWDKAWEYLQKRNHK